MKLAKETSTRLHAWDEGTKVFDAQGSLMEQSQADEFGALLWEDGLIAAAYRYANEDGANIDSQRSLYDFIVEKSNELFRKEAPGVAERKRIAFLQFVELWGAYIGSPIARQSLKYFWLEECLEGENPFVAETYHKILNAVADAAHGAEITLNCEVIQVKSERTESTGEHSHVQLRTSHGDTHQFDHVVVTTPLGWLKGNKHCFNPELPPQLSKAIDSISYGSLDKVYITFPSAFWQDPKDNDAPGNGASSASTHNMSSVGFNIWLRPSYAPSTNPDKWLQECMNLAALQPECAQPTLLFYIQGPQSKHIADMVDSATDGHDRDAKLIQHFKPYFSRLPNYDESNPDCKPKAVLATCWANDKFAGYGSYSNFQVGLEDGDKHIETMRHGMPERGIWLAGEHTAPFVALGTSTGAYWSGEAVARRIIEQS